MLTRFAQELKFCATTINFMNRPLADILRPTNLDEVVGQKHLLGDGKILKNIIENGKISNMIFYGPSGTGKTTVANIIASRTDKKFFKLNATTASVSDIREIVSEIDKLGTENGILLYLDEIQNFNKKQQQSLLEFIENGDITLVSSTTENPYFYVYNAILSRSTVFEFKPIEASEIEIAVNRAVLEMAKMLPQNKIQFSPEAVSHIAQMSCGDVRKAINAVEMSVYSTLPNGKNEIIVNIEQAEMASQKKALTYDKLGDNHYDILSAFQKSIRGSDVDASLHYLARLLAAGDLLSPIRRLMVIASEDIGMAYPNAAVIVKSCVDSALQLGLPEARIPLAQAVITLATAPKSNSVVCAIDMALSDIEKGNVGDIPSHLKDGHYGGAEKLGRATGYKYPHNYENNYVEQQYLPDNLKNTKYYVFGNNKNEDKAKQYWDGIKKHKEN